MTHDTTEFETLLKAVRACTVCAPHLPLGPRPVVQAHPNARILVVGQAPGRKVHETGIPFNDPSGDRLRRWMGIGRDVFYDETQIALIPMGFCYPGTGKNGDLPPRPECAPLWRARLLSQMPRIELTLVIGAYAQAWHLGAGRKKTLAATVSSWRDYGPRLIPLPHPSPRNMRWFKNNPWFEAGVVPYLQERIASLIE